jgi:hypothetical protein
MAEGWPDGLLISATLAVMGLFTLCLCFSGVDTAWRWQSPNNSSLFSYCGGSIRAYPFPLLVILLWAAQSMFLSPFFVAQGWCLGQDRLASNWETQNRSTGNIIDTPRSRQMDVGKDGGASEIGLWFRSSIKSYFFYVSF